MALDSTFEAGHPGGFEKDSVCGYGSPLNAAIRSGTPEMVRFMLDSGANVNYRESVGFTPLEAAAATRNLAAARTLLAHGADLKAQDDLGRTPLHEAIETGDLAIVRLLVEHRAPLEVVNKSGVTPLAEVVRQGRIEVLRYMLKSGANTRVLLDGKPLSRAPHPRGDNSPESREVKALLRQNNVP